MALKRSVGGQKRSDAPSALFVSTPIAGGVGARSSLIERLRARIRTIEQAPMSAPCPPAHHDMGNARPACIPAPADMRHPPSARSPWTFGIDEIDDALPWGGLALDGVHEIQAATYRDSWAALGFALALITRRMMSLPDSDKSPALWASTRSRGREFGQPYGPGFFTLGLDPDRLVVLEADRDCDLAWALEESLKARALAILLGQIDDGDWTLGRRLALAAQAHHTPCLIVSNSGDSGSKTSGLGAAFTRWRVAALASSPSLLDLRAPGPPRWRIGLERCRWGRSGRSWDVEWSYGAHCFGLAAPLADRTAEARDGQAVLRARSG